MYQERREKLLATLPEYSITILMSGKAAYNIGDERHPFDVDRSFFYYTGLDNENLVLMFVKTARMNQTILFIEPFDPVQAKWVGGKILADEAREISGIKDVRYVDSLKDTIAMYINHYGMLNQFTLCGELSKQEYDQPWPVADLFNEIRRYNPDVQIRNIAANTTRMRLVKDADEIEKMRKAISVTNAGIKAMMQASRDYIWENELEAYFDFVLKSEQTEHAFHTICAGGKNATVLHYGKNNQQTKPGDLVLVDLGAAYKYYNADISRTFPVSGKFTDRQREIYEIVLRANKMVMEVVRPGMTTRDLNNKVIEFYQQELPKIGLLKDGKTVRDYYWHGVSHHLGLETHDVSLFDEPLQPGNVITDEPGLYLEDEGIGVRIEDDIMITEDGCICLSENIMKEVDEIEAFMQNR
ncbi:MAG: aminopeptidase P family protein [Erysipelotrichaceae bacterium]|nr:aminopeptidase P family protein [Erysipelotrichaceae bacterium]MBQ2213754.1 aminopeptidase P family protein [Erysipelotrichaceae bacterium]